jgi:hypothetical protein
MSSLNIYKNTQEYRSQQERILKDKAVPGLSYEHGLSRFSTLSELVSMGTSGGQEKSIAEEARKSLDMLRANDGGDNVKQESSASYFNPFSNQDSKNIKQLQIQDAMIKQLQQDNPDLGIKTYEDIVKDNDKKYAELVRKDAIQTRDSTSLGRVVAGVAMISGYVKDDKINALSLLLPAGTIKAGAALATAKNFAATESIISGALFIKDRSTEAGLRTRAGETITHLDTAKELGIAMGLGAAIAGPLGAVAGRLTRVAPADMPTVATRENPYTADFSQKVDLLKERYANGYDIPKDIVDIATDMDHIARSTPAGMTQARHADNVGKSYADFIETGEVKPNFAVTEAPPPSQIIPEDIKVDSDSLSIDELQTRTIDDSKKILELDDMQITIDNVPVSARQKMLEVTEDIDILDAVSKCYSAGGPGNVV